MSWIEVTAASVGCAGFVMFALKNSIRAGLPTSVRIDDADEGVIPPAMREHVRALEALGFARSGPARTVHLPQTAIMVPMRRLDGTAFAATYRILAGQQTRTVCDVVSILEGPSHGLTTTMDIGAGCLDLADGSFLQIFRNASPDELWHRHTLGLRFLKEHGRRARHVTDDEFDDLLAASFRQFREVFERAPWRKTLIALGRVLFKRSPYRGPIAAQKRALESVGNKTFVYEAAGSNPRAKIKS